MKRLFTIIFLAMCFFTISASAATLTVTKTADTNDGVCDADCSLREAIFAAVSGDTIEFSTLFNSNQTITLGGTELFINKSLSIVGTGADKLTVSGDNLSRVFNINGAGITVSINALRIADGNNVCNGGGIAVQSATVNLNKTVISKNTVTAAAGTNCYGGGIDNLGILTITNSEISENFALARGNGGGIQNGRLFTAATLNLTNTTISGNKALTVGGGIGNGQVLNLLHCTITNNTAPSDAGITNSFLSGTTISNTIIARNIGTREVFGNFNSQGFNLIGDGTGATNLTQPTDQVGTNATPINAMLDVLSNNSGTTRTHALLTGSPAIDKGNSFGILLDQRGQNRTIDVGSIGNAAGGDGTDIGAFETLAPSAANAAISGRVVFAKNRGISRVLVTLTDMQGNSRTTLTNQFGNFTFENIPLGETYIINADAKGFEFSPQVLFLNETVSNLIIYATSR